MITVQTKNGEQHLIPIAGTILESLEKADIKVESHCRNGFCGQCRCKKVQGDVDYIDEPLGFKKADEILACVSRPKGDASVVISV